MKIAILAAMASLATLKLAVHTLNGDERAFPRDAAAPRAIFVVTLSKAASEQGSAWTRRLRATADLAAPVFQVAVLEEVPRLFRSMVISALTNQVPPALRDHFWVAVSDGAQWQRVSASSSQEDAHVFVLDQRDQVVWRTQGAVTDAKVSELLRLPPPKKSSSAPNATCDNQRPAPTHPAGLSDRKASARTPRSLSAILAAGGTEGVRRP